jgi:hypothetical protein
MTPMEAQEKELRQTLLLLRIQAFALCYAAPTAYAVVYATAVLQGRWNLFLQGFDTVPWTDPLLLGFLAASLAALAAAFTMPRLLPLGHGLPGLRTRGTVAFALIETVAILGLALGFLLGPAVATLILVHCLVPAALCPLALTSEEQARESLGGHA